MRFPFNFCRTAKDCGVETVAEPRGRRHGGLRAGELRETGLVVRELQGAGAKKAVLPQPFVCFPYVCPEPVLVKLNTFSL